MATQIVSDRQHVRRARRDRGAIATARPARTGPARRLARRHGSQHRRICRVPAGRRQPRLSSLRGPGRLRPLRRRPRLVRRRPEATRHPSRARAGVARPRRSRRRRLRGPRRRVHAAAGPSTGWTSCTARRRRSACPPRRDATATRSCGAAAATRCSRARSSPSSPAAWVATTRWSRSGTACPWFSPVWCRRPRITFLHHVHGPMWGQILPGPLAAFGRVLEAAHRPAVLPARPHGHPVRGHPRGAARARLPRRPGAGLPQRRRRLLLAGRRAHAATHRWWRSAGWRR